MINGSICNGPISSIFVRLLEPLEEIIEPLAVDFEGDETEPLCENLVLNYRGVIMYKDGLDCQSGYFF
jgi:hypothetical protein